MVFAQSPSDCVLNPYYVQTAGLQNYWTFCSTLTDVVTSLTLFNSLNAQFAANRNNNPSSAISFSNGYIQAPAGVYFNGGDYTIMAWVYPRTFNVWTRVIDFAQAGAANILLCALTSGTGGKPFTRFENQLKITSSITLQLNKWQHLSFTFSSSTLSGSIYVDGVLAASGTATTTPNNVVRTNNYIGKSNYEGNGYADAIYDEVKIFSVALTQSQIKTEMTNEYYGLFFFNY